MKNKIILATILSFILLSSTAYAFSITDWWDDFTATLKTELGFEITGETKLYHDLSLAQADSNINEIYGYVRITEPIYVNLPSQCTLEKYRLCVYSAVNCGDTYYVMGGGTLSIQAPTPLEADAVNAKCQFWYAGYAIPTLPTTTLLPTTTTTMSDRCSLLGRPFVACQYGFNQETCNCNPPPITKRECSFAKIDNCFLDFFEWLFSIFKKQ